jgi:hypothetical protein
MLLPTRLLFMAWLSAAVVGCGSDSGTSSDAVPEPYFDCAQQCRVVYLYVSNQSFAVSDVHISVLIDGNEAIAGEFEVRDQHHWVLHFLNIEPGPHTLLARARGHDADTTFEIVLGDPPIWGVLEFWFEDGPFFTFRESSQRPGFD